MIVVALWAGVSDTGTGVALPQRLSVPAWLGALSVTECPTHGGHGVPGSCGPVSPTPEPTWPCHKG